MGCRHNSVDLSAPGSSPKYTISLSYEKIKRNQKMPGLAHFLKNTLIIVISREEIKRDQNWPILKH